MATATKKPARKAGTRKSPARASTPPRAKDGTFKKANSGHWGTAAIVGGVAAVGAAATAALFALRGGTPSDLDSLFDTDKGAHQADGTDSSASFEAGIADEGTVPA